MPSSMPRHRAALLAAVSLSLSGCPSSPPPQVPAAADLASAAIAVAPPADLAAAAPERPGVAAAQKPPRPPVKAEQAPPASPRATDVKEADVLRTRVDSYFQGHVGRRIYLQTDKPLYKPGETIWLKVWDLKTRTLSGDHGAAGMILELVSPRGAVVQKRKIREQKGSAQADLPLPPGTAGGEYTLRVRTLDGQRGERPVIVSSYEAPRLQMKLEFLRKAYGAGDEVNATIAVRRPTGEALRDHALKALVRLDGQDLPQVALRTDANGEGVVRFVLPGRIEVGDGLLTVLADDGGLTESVGRRVPIVVDHLSFATFPEGGTLIEGLPGRVYFEAKNPLGKPADVAGRVVDDKGQIVGQLESVRDGLGRFDLSPQSGRSYHVEIDRPVGISEHYRLPLPQVAGCNLRSFDDLDGELSPLRVAVRCSAAQRVLVHATLRENVVDAAAVDVPAGAPAIVYLDQKGDGARLQGAARVTVFDDKLNPLCERLVYRNRRARMDVKVKAHKPAYSPREQVALTVSTTDPLGQPVSAELTLAVVDDTVLTFADDKTGHMLSRLYLEPELPGKIEEPNFYFDLSEEKSGIGLDLLMGTRGFRSFEWQPILKPGQVIAKRPLGLGTGALAKNDDFGGLRKKGKAAEVPAVEGAEKPKEDAAPADKLALAKPDIADKRGAKAEEEAPQAEHRDAKKMAPMKAATVAAPATPPMAAPKATVQPMQEQARARRPAADAPAEPAAAAPAPVLANKPMAGGRAGEVLGQGMGGLARDEMAGGVAKEKDNAPRQKMRGRAMDDMDGLAGDMEMPRRGAALRLAAPPRPRPPALDWAPVRVFPAPNYSANFSGPRTDFRETIFFQPEVRTGKDGQATITFYLSDAVSAFRVVTEGVAGGAAGRGEEVIKSSLPFSMAVKVPLEVSEGDHLELPLVLANERDRPLAVDLSASFGDLLKLDRPVTRTQGEIGAGAREALFYPLTVTGKRGKSKIRFAASASGLTDEFEREIVVVPRGFPQHVAKSGQVKDRYVAELDLSALIPGTGDGTLRLYPSPVAAMVSGLEGMLQEPSGCFEQASSANYPNIMILRYLKEQRHMDPALLSRSSQLLDSGYKKLVGYETPKKGYEWFGASPAHEALSAYGLLEFTDMQAVYADVDRDMVRRTAAWLRSRRDGKGGYNRDEKALDSFGRASKEVTDAYITYSLSEAKQKDIDPEIEKSARLAQGTDDSYLLALSTLSLFNYGRQDEGQKAAARLVSLQDPSGGFLKASHSITRSGGTSLQIETTALSILSLLKAGGRDEEARRAVEWLVGHRGGYGQFGATQSTVLALKALVAYAIASRRTQSPGDVILKLNGKEIAREHYEAGRRAPIVFADLARHLSAGKNAIEITHTGQTPLPFSLGVDYRSLKPASSPQAQVELATALERQKVGMGESVRLNVTAKNRSEAGQPMTLVRVGIPGGLAYQTWQLKELREKGLIAYYETGPREVNLYLRQMKPREEVRLPLDLLATTPGNYKAPASRAYLYYTSEHKSWADGTEVTITP